MSGLFHSATDHDRAHELAAWRLDGLLEPAEEAWLDSHLAACADCAAAAADYDTGHLLFQGLLDAVPEPPRDLWARTAASIEVQGAGRAGGSSRPSRRATGRLGWILAPVAGVAMVAIAVGAGMLNGQPAASPGSAVALATPMAVAANIQVLGQDEDGRLEIRTQNVSEVCPVGAETCSVDPSAETEQLAAMAQTPVVTGAILSPTRDRLVIVQGGEGDQEVYVVPVATATVERPTGTPGVPTAEPATPTPVQTADVATPGVTDEPVPTASSEAPAGSGTPAETPEPPASTPDPAESGGPAVTPTTEPTLEPSADATVEPSPEPTPAAGTEAPRTPAPSPSVEVTPGPDGAIQIASNVIVVGSVAAYNRSGSRFAFTARPADGSAGPDVYVWTTTEPRAVRLTDDHRSVFAGWHSGDLVVSRVGDRNARTYLVDPVDGTERGPVSDGWLPAISPNRAAAVWWDGEVRLARGGLTPVTGAGNLVLGPWEREGVTQQLAEGPLRGWSAQWDPSGSVLAVWTAGPTDAELGTLSLYRATGDGMAVDLDNPLLEDAPALKGFALDIDHLAWPAIGAGDTSVVRVLAWNSEGMGIVELPSEAGGTIVR